MCSTAWGLRGIVRFELAPFGVMPYSVIGVVPSVTMHRRFRPFVEDELPALAGASHRLVAHAAAHVSHVPAEGEVTLAIGPEGGWVPFELDLLGDHGFRPWSLGPRVLRVETAVVAALGRLV